MTVTNTPARAQNALQIPPAFIDREHGFTYFLVRNQWSHTVNNIFGSVYGFGSLNFPGLHIINNPHSEGMKVSLGIHYPGSVAMYRFQIPSGRLFFPKYILRINDNSLFYPSGEAR